MKEAILPFVAILLSAVALIPGGAHLFALPNKIVLDQTSYFTVQAIYLGWWKLGLVLVAVAATDAVLALRWRSRLRAPSVLAWVACLLVVGHLAIFFGWTFPANRATANWTIVPPDWERLRRAWEYSHAVNAALSFASLVCITAAGLAAAAAPIEPVASSLDDRRPTALHPRL